LSYASKRILYAVHGVFARGLSKQGIPLATQRI